MQPASSPLHPFRHQVSHLALPAKFTYPFHYTPHPLCVLAAEEVKAYLAGQTQWRQELDAGKMFGVLVVQTTEGIGYLAAFSGLLAGENLHPFFVPPVYDLLRPDGYFKQEEERISAINRQIEAEELDDRYLTLAKELRREEESAQMAIGHAKAEMKAAKASRELRRKTGPAPTEVEAAAMVRESQHQKAEVKRLERSWKERLMDLKAELARYEERISGLKAERKNRSAALQQWLFAQFKILNARGETKDLCEIFARTVHRVPPAGAGECALPKLLQCAYLHGWKPLAMAEFWWGRSPLNEVRYHGYYYPSCRGKCEPILTHALQGLEVDENPLSAHLHEAKELEVVFEDEWLLVVNKPAGMLSVPGKGADDDSVYRRMKERYPKVTGPLIVHRLDMATSGLLLVAKTKEVHRQLQAQFAARSIKKRYIALLDGLLTDIPQEGRISLPLCLDPLDRPRQLVSFEHGKPAITDYRLLEQAGDRTRVLFYPLTGRTHQLRVHAAHPAGLGHPIAGDTLYGQKAERLYLHAEYLEFRHPVSGDTICLQAEADF
ncbi:MAG: RNA pseudouridine synthase [Mediterranea sp.]|jgi:tRNA pseudouridine32 synthase/23S rRNA pseudouridine746 synthase|nr:RNA pseudouridine synthase [Mediterranea sp.]